MHSTKNEILALLKRLGGASVEELSSSLGLAAMTVRQHLTALERDDLVRADEVRRQVGRPHFRYELTDDGHRRMASGYDRLLALIVDESGRIEPNGAGPDGRRRLLFRNVAATLGERHRIELTSLTGVERVARIVAILRMHGGFAEWHPAAEGFELRDFGCVFRSSVGGDGPCDWHETFLQHITGSYVQPAPAPADACADCCRYIIPARSAAPAGSQGSP